MVSLITQKYYHSDWIAEHKYFLGNQIAARKIDCSRYNGSIQKEERYLKWRSVHISVVYSLTVMDVEDYEQ